MNAAKLNEAQLQELVQSWAARLAAAPDDGLSLRYAEAYAAAAEGLRQARRASSVQTPLHDSRFLNADVSTFREAAAEVALTAPTNSSTLSTRDSTLAPMPAVVTAVPPAPTLSRASPWAAAPPVPGSSVNPRLDQTALALTPTPAADHEDVDSTAPIPILSPRPALPFVPGEATPPPSGRAALRSPPVGSGTADISSFVPRDLFPFSGNTRSSSPPGPPPTTGEPVSTGRRLMYFDPQTGLPLAHPVWVDSPPDPKDSK